MNISNQRQIFKATRWVAFGIFFKALSFALGYISFAKGEKKFFFYLESLWESIQTLLFSFIAFYFLGLVGMGIAFTSSFFVYLALLFFLCKKRYQFYNTTETLRLFFLLLVFFPIIWIDSKVSYLISGCGLIMTLWFSFVELNNILDIKSFIHSKIMK